MAISVIIVGAIRFLVQYLIGLIGVPIYLVFLWMMYKYRSHHQFNNSFFALIGACGAADMLYFIHNFITFRIPSMGYLIQVFLAGGVTLATFSTVGLTYWLYAQVIGVVMMSYNRFTALVFLAKHDWMWRKEMLKPIVGCQFTIPLILVAPLVIRCQYRPDLRNGNTTLGVAVSESSSTSLCAIRNYGLLTIVCTSAVIVLVFMYTVMFYKTWKHSRKVLPLNHKTARDQRRRKAQFNLAMSGLVISVSLILVAIHRGVGTVFTVNPYIYYPIGSIVTNIYSLINPIAILATSQKSRAYFVITVKSLICIKPSEEELARLNLPIAMGTKTGKNLGLRSMGRATKTRPHPAARQHTAHF